MDSSDHQITQEHWYSWSKFRQIQDDKDYLIFLIALYSFYLSPKDDVNQRKNVHPT